MIMEKKTIISRYFLTDEDMNEFYLGLCEQYDSVEWGTVVHGETVLAEWYVE